MRNSLKICTFTEPSLSGIIFVCQLRLAAQVQKLQIIKTTWYKPALLGNVCTAMKQTLDQLIWINTWKMVKRCNLLIWFLKHKWQWHISSLANQIRLVMGVLQWCEWNYGNSILARVVTMSWFIQVSSPCCCGDLVNSCLSIQWEVTCSWKHAVFVSLATPEGNIS